MTNAWIAFCGKTPLLSKLELERQLPHFGGFDSIISLSDTLLQIKSKLPTVGTLNRFGGITRASLVVGHVSRGELVNFLSSMITNDAEIGRDIGLSCVSGMSGRELTRLGLDLKKQLKELHKLIRIVLPNTETMLSTVVVQKQIMDKGGVEFVLNKNGERWDVLRTVWVHPFASWSEREFGKPDVDVRRGLLPQKLARMMINVTGLNLGSDVTIIDPFCGSGVVLQEARELGCQFFGSDIDGEAVRATKNNLGLTQYDNRVRVADARTVQYPRLDTQKTAIVCEPWLGPVWHSRPLQVDLDRTIREISVLYLSALKHWKTFLPAGAPVVMVFPVIFGHTVFQKTVDNIVRLKYSSNTRPIRYEREHQMVTRDIVVLCT